MRYSTGCLQAGGAPRSNGSQLRARHEPDATGPGGYHLPAGGPADELDTEVDTAQVELVVRPDDTTKVMPELTAAG